MIQRWNPKGLIAYPTRKSIRRFRDRVRMLTRRSAQRRTAALIKELNPTLRGWAEYYKRAHVRTLFHKLDGWIVRRIWLHRFRRWWTRGWIQLPKAKLYEEFGLVNLISLIPRLVLAPVHERLRESCMPEIGTYSLSGGRRLARQRASFDPTGNSVSANASSLRSFGN